MTDIFKEVDEDLRREKLEKLWKKYAPVVIGFVVLVIGGMAGRVYWQEQQKEQRIAESEAYQSALRNLDQENRGEALRELQILAGDAEFGYGLLSRLQAAALLARQGRIEDSLAAYDAIAANSNYERRYRDYASLMAGLLALDAKRYDEAAIRLEPLAAGEGTWSYSAKELLGLMALEQEDWQRAGEIFRDLNVDPGAPAELKARAGEYLRIVDVKKPQSALNQTEPLAEDNEPVAQEGQ